jgi:membrane complex biogenesis BtpA family protein
MTPFARLFPPQPIIGMIALPPSPGYPASPGVDALVAAALADLAALEAGGAHAVLVENDFDQPHTLTVGPEVVAALTRVVAEVVRQARIPVGVQALLNDWRASLAIAAAGGARFVRLDFFVDRVRIPAGVIEPEPAAVLAYRKAIGAQHVALLTDIQVKYSTPAAGPKPLERSAAEARAAGADAIVVTGAATGSEPSVADLLAARAGAGSLPILIGSGLTPENCPRLFPHCDGAIVGTALRSGPAPHDRVDENRVRALVRAIPGRGTTDD